jgi:hypothetical protein
MFWIIIVIIFGILAAIQIYKDVDARDLSTFGIVCIVITIISTVTVFAQGIAGITEYPDLTKRLGQVEALQNRVKDIKESTYTYEKDGNFVAGSIENINQSTNLSKFITELAKKEADYKGRLQECKAYKEVFTLYFFGPGWAMSNKINDLPILK